jgi:ABC-type glycerol-3-phosphate transport system substrate-binding protein
MGGLEKLDDLLARDGVDESDFLLPLSKLRISGGLYGMPQDFRIPVLAYRKSQLEAAGIAPPETWDEVCTAGGKLAKGSVVGYPVPTGAAGGTGGAQHLVELVLASALPGDDGMLFEDDGRKIAFTKERFVKIAQVLKDLIETCKTAPLATIQFAMNDIHDGLRAGTMAMATFPVFRYKSVQNQGAGDDLAWSTPPGFTPTDKQGVYGQQLSINVASKNKEAAWEFVKFMSSKEAHVIAAEGGEVVARRSAYDDPYLQSPQTENQRAWAELIEDRGMFTRYSVINPTFNEILGDALQRMLLQGTTPEEAYDEVVTRYNEELDRL